MSSLNLSLSMLTGYNAPDGESGWYISIFSSDKGHLIEASVVPESAAKVIGNAFDVIVKNNDISAKISPGDLIVIGETEIRKAIEQELEFAENQAKRVAGLRRRLQKYDETNERDVKDV